MLSILIPTYDYTCYKLVADLHQQAERLGVPYEILVAEDGSKSQVTIIANHKITELSHCRHIINRENRGHAGIRNFLARQAVYDWLLFLDSDAKVEKPDFLQSYLSLVNKADVIVGGLYHQTVNHDKNRSLRFKYEKLADQHRSAAERSLCPYGHFTTFNFLIRRSVFLCILFDENCHEYGYEDALFGVELERHHISILHIDNALLHQGLDTNESFLHKAEAALRTLHGLNGKMNGRSHVENAYKRLAHYRLGWLLRLNHRLLAPLMRRNLLSANPSLTLLNIYKLGYYACLK